MPPPAEGLASRLIVGPTLRTQSDGRLVALVRAGYETAFEEIVRRYGRPLSRYAAAMVGGGSEDVTQDAFSKAHLALRRNDAEIELRPWLFRIVRNTALNHLRDRPPTPEVLAEAIAGGRTPAEEVEQREELAELMKRLQALPEPQRAAIVMRELEGLSHEQIAAALGLSGGAARQAIYRARCALRDGLGMLVPLPLLKTALAAAAGVTGPAEAATGTAGAAGAGMALKATMTTVLLAGTVGAGVAVQDAQHAGRAGGTARASKRMLDASRALTAGGGPAAAATQDRPGGNAVSDGAHHRTESQPKGAGNGSGTTRRGSSGQNGGGTGQGGGDHSSTSTPTNAPVHNGGPGNDSGSGSTHSGPDSGSGSGGGSGPGGEGSSPGGSGSGGGSGSSDSSESTGSSGSSGTSGSGSGESNDGGSGGGSAESSTSGSGSGDSSDLSSSSGLIQQTAP